jgi:hypothetical protein
MQHGGAGTVTRPTFFLAGVRGPEQYAFSGEGRTFAQSPRFAPAGTGGGPVTINVHAEGAYFDTPASRARLADQVGRAVMDQLRRERRL